MIVTPPQPHPQLDAVAEVDGPQELVLDTRGLAVRRVELLETGGAGGGGGGGAGGDGTPPQALTYRLAEPHAVRGLRGVRWSGCKDVWESGAGCTEDSR